MKRHSQSCDPFTPTHIVSDDLLKHFANSTALDLSVFSDEGDHCEMLAQMVMVFPDLCRELLNRRNLMAAHRIAMGEIGDHAEGLAKAIRGDDPDPIERGESLAQFNADELAELDARVTENERDIARLKKMLVGTVAC